jgi:hypothetical protein
MKVNLREETTVSLSVDLSAEDASVLMTLIGNVAWGQEHPIGNLAAGLYAALEDEGLVEYSFYIQASIDDEGLITFDAAS